MKDLVLLGILLSIPVMLNATQPNFVIILADDLGFDLQCFGHPSQEWGPIDRMANEGMRFTHWYSAASMCTPSRSALMTGRLPIRSGMAGPERILDPLDSGGLPHHEITIAEELSLMGYTTGMVGKWHLGINKNEQNDGFHLPEHHGFQYVGTNYPYGQMWECNPDKFSEEEMAEVCFKYENSTIIQQPVELENTTQEMVAEMTEFISLNKNLPFFFFFSLLQTHSSLFCSKQFCGKSKRGLYGDSVNEMAWAVGEVLDTLKRNNLEQDTMVLFLSDNGPQKELCNQGGASPLFKGGEASTWDGGIRVPALAWWPGTIPQRSVSESIVSTMDIYPTIMHFAGRQQDTSVTRDGMNIADLLTNQNSSSPHEFLFHYCSTNLMAVHYKSYKFHYMTQTATMDLAVLCKEGIPLDNVQVNFNCEETNIVTHDPPLIFNIDVDPGEAYPLNPRDFQQELVLIADAVTSHKASIVSVPSQLGNINKDLQPCCDPPKCSCNYGNKGNILQATKHLLVPAVLYTLLLPNFN